jgi:predicted TIM-barrel fold metal-dependent hydrolase
MGNVLGWLVRVSGTRSAKQARGSGFLREALTRVLRSYGIARGETAAGLLSLTKTAPKTDCDFDPDAWDRGEQHLLAASGIGRVVLSRLPAMGATRLPIIEGTQPSWRAVIDVPEDTSKASLSALHAVGVRGVRFDLGTEGRDSLDPLLTFADRIVPFGWHVEIKLGAAGAARALAKAEWRLMQFPLAVCFSGLGSHRQHRHAAAFDFVLDMMQLGRYWLKLSNKDLIPSELKIWDEPPPLERALQAVRKDRLIWGSGKRPDGDGAGYLASSLALLEKSVPNPGDREQVLTDNPVTLYGFDNGNA